MLMINLPLLGAATFFLFTKPGAGSHTYLQLCSHIHFQPFVFVTRFFFFLPLCPLQKFNPKIFKKMQKNGSSSKASCPYCCCAVGSKDRSVSVWVSEMPPGAAPQSSLSPLEASERSLYLLKEVYSRFGVQ